MSLETAHSFDIVKLALKYYENLLKHFDFILLSQPNFPFSIQKNLTWGIGFSVYRTVKNLKEFTFQSFARYLLLLEETKCSK